MSMKVAQIKLNGAQNSKNHFVPIHTYVEMYDVDISTQVLVPKYVEITLSKL